MSVSGSIMFLLTIFIMDGPKAQPEEAAPKDAGHDNDIFTTADETNLPTITAMVANTKNNIHETSRL
jgi:hypothetical protein